jgi:hypothetical protein
MKIYKFFMDERPYMEDDFVYVTEAWKIKKESSPEFVGWRPGELVEEICGEPVKSFEQK